MYDPTGMKANKPNGPADNKYDGNNIKKISHDSIVKR